MSPLYLINLSLANYPLGVSTSSSKCLSSGGLSYSSNGLKDSSIIIESSLSSSSNTGSWSVGTIYKFYIASANSSSVGQVYSAAKAPGSFSGFKLCGFCY